MLFVGLDVQDVREDARDFLANTRERRDDTTSTFGGA